MMSLYNRLKLTRYRPSSEMADLEEGQLLKVGRGTYVLVGRDPWVAYLVRWFWWDHLHYTLKKKLRRNEQRIG